MSGLTLEALDEVLAMIEPMKPVAVVTSFLFPDGPIRVEDGTSIYFLTNQKAFKQMLDDLRIPTYAAPPDTASTYRGIPVHDLDKMPHDSLLRGVVVNALLRSMAARAGNDSHTVGLTTSNTAP